MEVSIALVESRFGGACLFDSLSSAVASDGHLLTMSGTAAVARSECRPRYHRPSPRVEKARYCVHFSTAPSGRFVTGLDWGVSPNRCGKSRDFPDKSGALERICSARTPPESIDGLATESTVEWSTAEESPAPSQFCIRWGQVATALFFFDASNSDRLLLGRLSLRHPPDAARGLADLLRSAFYPGRGRPHRLVAPFAPFA